MSGVNKTKIGLFLVLSIFVLSLVFIGKNKENKIEEITKETETVDGNINEAQEKISIAVCPTYWEIAKKLDSQKYEIVTTQSTSASVELVKNQRADFLLAGRTLKNNEPRMENIVFDKGLSFISHQEFFVQIKELKEHQVYTDLDVDMIKNSFPVEKIEKVENVYQYLDKGIAVTSWENTDYSKASIIHLLEDSGERVKLSRQLTLYCPSECDAKIVADITSVL